MNTKAALTLFCIVVSMAGSQTAFADTNSAYSNGLYRVSSIVGRSTVRSYERADIQIHKAHVYSVTNSNTDFEVSLDTSDLPDDSIIAKPVVLQIGNHVYPTARVGGSGTVKAVDWMIFKIHNQNEAKVAAKWLSVDCALRTPLEPKFSAQFIPAKSEFHTNEPVLVNFVMTNLDDRTITFENAGPARFQYDFQAMLNGRRVSEIKVDDLMPFNGSIFLVNLEPGKEFDRHVDLKGWFAFNKVGTYKIHGSSDLKFFNKSGDTAESHQMWKVMWNGNASTDFTVVVK